MDSAGDSSRLVGFRLAYRDTAPEVGQIAGSIGEKPQTWYPRERYLDWHVALFSKHGIAAFVEKSGGNETVSLLILTSPSRVGKIVQGFVQRKTPISSLSKKYPESQRIATFGQALVSIREDGLSMANSDSFRQELEDKIRKQSLSSRLRYRSGSSGSLRVTLKLIKPRGQDGRVDVSASFSGNSSFGTITSFGSHSEKFGRSLFGIVNVDKVRARYAFDQALSDTIRSAESSLQKRIPRDPVALSHQTWDAAVTRGTL
jgi:hypothetical protein